MADNVSATTIPLEVIPAMPAVATRVMDFLGRKEVRQEELAEVISSDAALAAKILQIANSPFYGFSARFPPSGMPWCCWG